MLHGLYIVWKHNDSGCGYLRGCPWWRCWAGSRRAWGAGWPRPCSPECACAATSPLKQATRRFTFKAQTFTWIIVSGNSSQMSIDLNSKINLNSKSFDEKIIFYRIKLHCFLLSSRHSYFGSYQILYFDFKFISFLV